MAGQKGRSGGARPGAGRPPKQHEPTGSQYDSAEAYLAAVVAGVEPPDPVRVQAAKCLMGYQQPKQRAKPMSKSPGQLHRQNELSAEAVAKAEWRARAEEIRRKHREKTE